MTITKQDALKFEVGQLKQRVTKDSRELIKHAKYLLEDLQRVFSHERPAHVSEEDFQFALAQMCWNSIDGAVRWVRSNKEQLDKTVEEFRSLSRFVEKDEPKVANGDGTVSLYCKNTLSSALEEEEDLHAEPNDPDYGEARPGEQGYQHPDHEGREPTKWED